MLYSNRLLETISSLGLRAAALSVGPLHQKHFVGISLLIGQGGGMPTHNNTHTRSLPGWHHKEAEAFFSPRHLNENTRSSSDTSRVWEECSPPFVGFHFTLSARGVSGWLRSSAPSLIKLKDLRRVPLGAGSQIFHLHGRLFNHRCLAEGQKNHT